MKVHVPSMLAKDVKTINKRTQQWLIKFIKHSHKWHRKYLNKKLNYFIHVHVIQHDKLFIHVHVIQHDKLL